MPSQSPCVTLTQQLLGFNTINPPGNEVACMNFLADWLQQQGFMVRQIEFGEQRSNLIAHLPGKKPGLPLAFTGHVDTVPLGNQPWQHDPFGSQIIDDRLYGRGSSDMKAAIAAFILACMACKAVISDQSSGIVLILTGGEETGCDGARALLNDPDLPQVTALIVGEPTANYPVIGHKGALWLRAITQGKTAHGAMPELGINAIYLASDAINKIRHFSVGEAHPLMRHPTLNVGRIQGGLNINSVPDRTHFDVDIRTAPNLDHYCIRQRLAEELGSDVSLETLVDLPAVLTSNQHPWIQQVMACCQRFNSEPLQPRIVPYFTDASLLLAAIGHPPCIILGPGEPSQAHQTDEYCHISKLIDAQQLYQELIQDWANRGYTTENH